MSTASTEKLKEVTGKKKIKRYSDVSDWMARRNLQLSPVGALNTITPCAACKLLRRRCARECPFSPYFSPHEPQKFASVHKVFGASNVSKMLTEVPEPQRADAANSLVYEANVRLRDPVYGCMGTILALQQQVQALEAELAAVRAEILNYRYRQSISSAASLIAPSSPIPAQPPQTAQAAASSSSSMYMPTSTSTDYSSITSDNVSFFG